MATARSPNKGSEGPLFHPAGSVRVFLRLFVQNKYIGSNDKSPIKKAKAYKERDNSDKESMIVAQKTIATPNN